ncbi:uncharacterized protein LOC114326559 [Diabrotica virgifera virgifera]|nr:uncharacterized protein LOC114326559 [Diabrotica virgifera virgifera]XP_050513182.1 uncharacterized protein LOC114326559 [Diabrotica virgifera virgifera]XP_050513183.1 uncharacterized protein LOC114326559 [Diabrotica virgifera virgifera]
MKGTLLFLVLLISSTIAQHRIVRAKLGNLGAPQTIDLPDLGFAQGFLPSSLANAKHVNIKISKAKSSGFGAGSGNAEHGENIGFTARGAFSDNSGANINGIRGGFGFSSNGGSTASAGNTGFGVKAQLSANNAGVRGGFDFSSNRGNAVNAGNTAFGATGLDNSAKDSANFHQNTGKINNEIRGGFGFSSQGSLSGNTGFGFTSNEGNTGTTSNGNLDTGVTLDSFEFFDKHLHEAGPHLSPFPIIPSNISHEDRGSQHQSGFSGGFTKLPGTSIPQPFNHNQGAFNDFPGTRPPTKTTTKPTTTTTTTTPRPFEFSGHIPTLPVHDFTASAPRPVQDFENNLPQPVQDFRNNPHPPVQDFRNNIPPPVQDFGNNPPQHTQNVNQLSADFPQVPALSGQSFEEVIEQEWSSFTTRFNKVYASQDEARFRREVFIENRAKIMRFNMDYAEGRRNFVFKINEFADMLLHEFNNNFNGFNRSRREPDVPLKPASTFVPSANVVFPDSVDWRMVGAVSPVKSQGKCAGCWAFAAAGALEGHTFRKTGKLVEVSAQNLIDCTQPYGNNGCAGGLMDPAFEYVRDNNGVDSDQSYPYEGVNGQCRFRREDVVATCTGFVDIGENDEKGLEIALATLGPVTAAIDAGKETFQFYSEGIYDDPACGNTPEQMNHAVLIVGYGQEADGRKYWLVKNSYGPNWGIGGYVKMAKENNNQCGIAIQASYPLV